MILFLVSSLVRFMSASSNSRYSYRRAVLPHETLNNIRECQRSDHDPLLELDELLRSILLERRADIHARKPASAEEEVRRPVRRSRATPPAAGSTL